MENVMTIDFCELNEIEMMMIDGGKKGDVGINVNVNVDVDINELFDQITNTASFLWNFWEDMGGEIYYLTH